MLQRVTSVQMRSREYASSLINTATLYHLGIFPVVPCFAGSRIRNEEATGSIPVSSTIVPITCKPFPKITFSKLSSYQNIGHRSLRRALS